MDRPSNVVSTVLFNSDFYEIKNWTYAFGLEQRDRKGYNDCLCLLFVRKGIFAFDRSRRDEDLYPGHALIEKPDYEYHVRPSSGQCTIVNFTENFYHHLLDEPGRPATFLSKSSPISVALPPTPESEYLHFQIIRRAGGYETLQMDTFVTEFLFQVLTMSDRKNTRPAGIVRASHEGVIGKAKEYLNEHFAEDISLYQLSYHCCVSPFHFSRIFRTATTYTPNQYLLKIRLKHGEVLLKNSSHSVTEIARACGFNSPEYFSTVFNTRYRQTPTEFRRAPARPWQLRHTMSRLPLPQPRKPG